MLDDAARGDAVSFATSDRGSGPQRREQTGCRKDRPTLLRALANCSTTLRLRFDALRHSDRAPVRAVSAFYQGTFDETIARTQ